jgi:hypothetical protein
LELEDHEMFTDAEGNTLDIEVRGEREQDKCFFRAKSVENAFKMNKLCKSIINLKSSYELNSDYKYFIPPEVINDDLCANKNKEIYLTYQCILRVLFCSRTGLASTFIIWTTHTLFTVLFLKAQI